MKTTTPKKIARRDRLVDSMAKKLADGNGVEKVITIHRKRRFGTMSYVYIALGVSAISTLITYLVMTGRVAPGLTAETNVVAAPVSSTLDLLNADLASEKIRPDRYALYLKDYLIRYDSLPEAYKVAFSGLTSDEVYRALFDIWPRLSLRTRSDLLKQMPFLTRKWERFTADKQP